MSNYHPRPLLRPFRRQIFILPLLAIFAVLTGCIIDDEPVADRSAEKKSNFNLKTSYSKDVAQDADFSPRAGARPQEPITQIKLVAAKDAPTEKISDDELVLGVEINGESRAYPIVQLCGPKREIINDQLGGQAIAATW